MQSLIKTFYAWKKNHIRAIPNQQNETENLHNDKYNTLIRSDRTKLKTFYNNAYLTSKNIYSHLKSDTENRLIKKLKNPGSTCCRW